jgi:uncharacterized membrane protein YidH (DUF202 family)
MDIPSLVNYFGKALSFILSHLGDIALLVAVLVAAYYIIKWAQRKKKMRKEMELDG